MASFSCRQPNTQRPAPPTTGLSNTQSERRIRAAAQLTRFGRSSGRPIALLAILLAYSGTHSRVYAQALPAHEAQEPPVGQYAPCSAPSLRLSVSPSTVTDRAHLPKFRLTIVNETARPLRLLDIRHRRRPDLQAAYFSIKLAQDGRFLWLSESVSGVRPRADFRARLLPHGGAFGNSTRTRSATVRPEVLEKGALPGVCAVLEGSAATAPATRCLSAPGELDIIE